jgi:hypothetical protein
LGPPPTGRIPFAIAKLYRLPLTEPVEPRRRNSFTPLLQDENQVPNEILAQQYTPEQLCMIVEAEFPRGGGRIVAACNSRGEIRYVVRNRHGDVVRILWVDDQGRIMEERRRTEQNGDEDEGERKSNSIRLGLGDFIFYSVLTAKAVQYSFSTFAACFLVVLAGLGGTLILLAVYRHALPALPISILLGVVFYLLTRIWIQPWIEELFQSPLYV